MNKFFLVLILSILASAIYYFNQSKLAPNQYRIAILTPISHGALEEIIAGFKATLDTKLPCVFETFNAHGDRVLLRSQAEMIIQSHKYDLALVISTQPSLIIKEISKQRNSNLPIVCTAVDDPVKNGIIKSLESSGNNITTVTESLDQQYYQKQLEHLNKLFPKLKKLLLVYSPGVMLDREKDLLAHTCQESQIKLTVLPIFDTHEIAQKIKLLIPEQDGVIILKDNTVVSCIETLVQICQQFSIPLCASDLNSLNAGATCAYGVLEAEFGIQAAHKAYAILHDQKNPATVASSQVNQASFQVNQKSFNALTNLQTGVKKP